MDEESQRGFPWQPVASWVCLSFAITAGEFYQLLGRWWSLPRANNSMILDGIVFVCLAMGCAFAISGIDRGDGGLAYFFSCVGFAGSVILLIFAFANLLDWVATTYLQRI